MSTRTEILSGSKRSPKSQENINRKGVESSYLPGVEGGPDKDERWGRKEPREPFTHEEVNDGTVERVEVTEG